MDRIAPESFDALRSIGFSEADLAAWVDARPTFPEPDAARRADLPGAAARVSRYLGLGGALRRRLPPRARRGIEEERAVQLLDGALRNARDEFLRAYGEAVYATLTDHFRSFRRADELVYLAAERFPGLTPTRADVAGDARLPLKEKEGVEIDQGIFLSWIFSHARPGAHLIHGMLRPRPDSEQRLAEFRRTGALDLGTAVVERRGRAAYVSLRNTQFLNAEDDATNDALEAAVDLALLDPAVEVGVIRGAPVDHPKYAGRRVFNAGLNLTRLYHGEISFLFYLTRELGLLNKLYRGLGEPRFWPEGPERTQEKPWIAAVEAFAIGGGCQILLTVDRVLAEGDAFFSLPARKEGIVPGCANLRLARWVEDRLARQAILFDRAFPVDGPEGRLLCDVVVPPAEMDAAIEAAVASLGNSGVVSAAANRKALRVAQEPLALFQAYLATYAREQAFCHFSPALVRNLEQYWDARRRNRGGLR